MLLLLLFISAIFIRACLHFSIMRGKNTLDAHIYVKYISDNNECGKRGVERGEYRSTDNKSNDIRKQLTFWIYVYLMLQAEKLKTNSVDDTFQLKSPLKYRSSCNHSGEALNDKFCNNIFFIRAQTGRQQSKLEHLHGTAH